jgi:hypothetical protein
MGIRTESRIAAWQKAAGIVEAKGEYARILTELSQAAFEAIKIIERELSGIRDGDGYWHGSDVIGGTTSDLITLCNRLMETSVKPDPRTGGVGDHQQTTGLPF